ncbi:MAG: hypothetical protein ACI4F5_05040 [Acutalibacteraceae bacterium]
MGIEIMRSNICGGSKSKLWKTIFANVSGISLDSVKTEQGPSYGGAINKIFIKKLFKENQP